MSSTPIVPDPSTSNLSKSWLTCNENRGSES
jgi:hypothetical protein